MRLMTYGKGLCDREAEQQGEDVFMLCLVLTLMRRNTTGMNS